MNFGKISVVVLLLGILASTGFAIPYPPVPDTSFDKDFQGSLSSLRFPLFAIVTSSEDIYVGDTYQETFYLTPQETTDSDWTDGTVSYSWIISRIYDSSDNVVYEDSKQVNLVKGQQVAYTVTYKISKKDNYAVIVLLATAKMEYDRGSANWVIVDKVVEDKKTVTLNVKEIAPPTPPSPNIFMQILQQILEWLKSLFGR